MITVALAKGRLAEQTMELMERAGIDCEVLRHQGRKLVFDNGQGYRFILVKPSDVPTYVHHGVADVGVAGKDTLMEENRPLYEMLDLRFGACRMCVAGDPHAPAPRGQRRVATKYPNIARNYYAAKGENIEVIKLNGSVELGPVIGLSDVILDIVESGATLKANGLSVIEEICTCSARLVVNRVSLKTKEKSIRPLIDGLRKQIEMRKDEA